MDQAAVSRRRMLQAAVIGATGIAASRVALGGAPATARGPLEAPLIFHSPEVQPFVDPLPIQQQLTGGRYDLVGRTTMHRFHSSWDPSPAFAYGDATYGGPVLENQADAETQLTFNNRLGAHPFAKDFDLSLHGPQASDRIAPRSVLHMHGGVTPPESDGHPQMMIAPGEQFTHRFPNRQQAAGLWYHDHAMGMTRLNTYAGLASMYLLRDRWDTGCADNPLGLPAGRWEVPLSLQEKIFTRGGQQSIRSTRLVPQGSWEGGAVGDVGVVNGAVWPELDVDRGLYRFRVLNAGSYSVWNLFFDNHMPFWVIGNDGGLLDAPVRTTSLRLSPAERVDILVDFSRLRAGDTVTLRNDEKPPFQAAMIGEVTMPMFMRFKATSHRGFTGQVPATLRGGHNQPPRLPAIAKPTVVRNLTISQPFDLRMPPSIMTLNNQRFTSTDIEKPRQGTVERWNFINVTPDPHPIHIHLVHFRIVARQAFRRQAYTSQNLQPQVGVKWNPPADRYLSGTPSGPAPWESGWKDTVRVDGDTVTSVIVRFPTADELGFDPDAVFTAASHAGSAHGGGEQLEQLQGYVWHCHILDHEDHDMMLKYRTIA